MFYLFVSDNSSVQDSPGPGYVQQSYPIADDIPGRHLLFSEPDSGRFKVGPLYAPVNSLKRLFKSGCNGSARSFGVSICNHLFPNSIPLRVHGRSKKD